LSDASQISPGVESEGGRGRREPGEPAQRALAEARQRRLKAAPAPPREVNGRDGPDPVRYGDWEVNGLASDF
jgi:hypothetical protein